MAYHASVSGRADTHIITGLLRHRQIRLSAEASHVGIRSMSTPHGAHLRQKVPSRHIPRLRLVAIDLVGWRPVERNEPDPKALIRSEKPITLDGTKSAYMWRRSTRARTCGSRGYDQPRPMRRAPDGHRGAREGTHRPAARLQRQPHAALTRREAPRPSRRLDLFLASLIIGCLGCGGDRVRRYRKWPGCAATSRSPAFDRLRACRGNPD
jgi:hypothetical protein